MGDHTVSRLEGTSLSQFLFLLQKSLLNGFSNVLRKFERCNIVFELFGGGTHISAEDNLSIA